MSLETDVLIAGAGMAGLTAGVRATELGADVLVVEKGSRPGGSMYLSGGVVWTLETPEEAAERVPDGNDDLQSIVVERFPDGLDWLRENDVGLHEPTSELPGPAKQIEPSTFTETMCEHIQSSEGEIRLESSLDRLQTNEAGAVTGAVVRSHSGETLSISANSVILATGGFQGNERLLQRYVTDHTERLWLRANPWSTGDGFTAASDVGAKATNGLGTFYGHSLPAAPAEVKPTELTEATQYYGPWTVALNSDGNRFVDESLSTLEETLVQAIARRADGRAYYVFDADLFESTISAGKAVEPMVERAEEFGGRVARAPTLEELCSRLSEWGVNGNNAHDTIEEFNRAIEADRAEGLVPSRRDLHVTVDTPPFYAVEVEPGITFTMGGLDVTGDMAVIRRSTSTSTIDHYPEEYSHVQISPIPGLYAAGVDVGNVSNRYYMGGLAMGLTTGLVAAESAVEHASTERRT